MAHRPWPGAISPCTPLPVCRFSFSFPSLTVARSAHSDSRRRQPAPSSSGTAPSEQPPLAFVTPFWPTSYLQTNFSHTPFSICLRPSFKLSLLQSRNLALFILHSWCQAQNLTLSIPVTNVCAARWNYVCEGRRQFGNAAGRGGLCSGHPESFRCKIPGACLKSVM